MDNKLSLRTVGIIAGASAVFAFLFGLLISAGLPGIANRAAAEPNRGSAAALVNETGESPFTQVAEIVLPAVVNISAERIVRTSAPNFSWDFGGPFDEWFREFFRDMPRGNSKSQTLGSGFIISEDGYVVTNNHVVRDASRIIVRIGNKKEFKGDEVKVVGTDPKTDLALLKIDTKEHLPYLKFGDSDKIRVGDWAIAIGDPFNLDGSMTVGVISAKGRSGIPLPDGPSFQNFLQTDAAINPGNSGGPLVNIRGEVIGINSAITTPSGGNVGIGFAIPVNLAKTVIEELKAKGKVTRGYLGIYLQELTDDLRKGLDVPARSGILVSEVMENTPASRAGLKAGDVIIEFNGDEVESVESFRFKVASTPVGKTVPVKLIREGKERMISVKIGEMPEETATAPVDQNSETDLGLQVVELNDPRARNYNPVAEKGVLVIRVAPDSPAAEAGIAVGDVITAVDKREIQNIDDYRAALAAVKKGKTVIVQVQQQARKRYIAVTP